MARGRSISIRRQSVRVGKGAGRGHLVTTIQGEVTLPSASLSTLTIDAATQTAGGSIVATITLLDADSNPLVGVSPTVSVAPSTGISVTGSGVTDGSGVTTRTIVTSAPAVGVGLIVSCVANGITLDDAPTFDVTAAVGTIWADIWTDIWADIWATA